MHTSIFILLYFVILISCAPSWSEDIKPCFNVWEKMHEIYPSWVKRMKFHGVGIGELDSEKEWGMAFLVASIKASEDEIPFNLAKCLTTMIETTAEPKFGSNITYISIFAYSKAENTPVAITSTYNVPNVNEQTKVYLGKEENIGTVVQKHSSFDTDCAVLKVPHVQIETNHLSFSRPNVSEVVINAQRNVTGKIRFLRFRQDINNVQITRHFVVRPIDPAIPFCNGEDNGSLIFKQSSKGNVVLGMISGCYNDGPLKGNALGVYWDHIAHECGVTLEKQNKKDEL